jgi:hypothetical protein
MSLKSSCPNVKKISLFDIQAMYQLYERYYDIVSFEEFVSDLSKKQAAILVRESDSNKIVGFSTIMDLEIEYEGKKINGLFSGDTIMEREYWGNTALHQQFLKYVVRRKIESPTHEFYWFLISKGYKTYLLMANNFQEYFPRVEQETPSKEQKIIQLFSEKLYPESFDPEKKLIVFPYNSVRLKGGVAPINDDLLSVDKIKFFQDRNPTWRTGTELPCIGKITFTQFGHSFFKLMAKSVRKQLPTLLLEELREKNVTTESVLAED